MPDLLDMIDEIDIEVNPPVEKSIEIEDLNPPPKPVIKKPAKSLKIDFNKIANKAYFQRFIQNLFKDIMPEMFKGIDFRVSKDVAVEIFDNKIDDINKVYDAVEKLKQGKTGDYRIVMNELKKKLAKQKVKVENGTN